MLNLVFLFILSLIAQPLIAQVSNKNPIQTHIAAALPEMGVAGPVTGILHNQLIIAGGANFPEAMPWKGGTKMYQNTIFMYRHIQSGNGIANQNTTLELVNQHHQLPEPIAYAAVCSVPDGILYAGGENANGNSNKTWFLQWNQQQQKVILKAYPALPIALTNASAVCVDNRVYLLGGETSNATSAAFYFLDLENLPKGWQSLGNLPIPLSHLVLTAIKKESAASLYIMGGRQKNSNGVSSFSKNAYRYHIQNKSWEILADMPYALSAGTGVWWNSDQIVLLGGDRGIVFNQVEKLILAITNETDPVKKQELIHQKNLLQESHPGFSKEVLVYAANTNQWNSIGNLSQETPVTTTALIWNSAVYIPSGEIKAGVRSQHILQISFQPPHRE